MMIEGLTLIAFDALNVIVRDGDKTLIYTKGSKTPRQINQYLIGRIGSLGFKEVSLNVSSIEDAWLITEQETKKNFKIK